MDKDTENLNLTDSLNSNKFKLVFKDLRAMEILCTSAPIPGVSSNPIEVPNVFNKLHVQGTKFEYEPLTIGFRMDKNMVAYKQILKWITDIHSPQSHEGFKEFQNDKKILSTTGNVFSSDASLFSLTNSMNANIEFVFVGMFPINLSGVDFSVESGSSTPLKGNATFRYDYFYIK